MGLGGHLRHSHGLSTRALGKHVRGTLVGAQPGLLADSGCVSVLAPVSPGLHRLGGVPLRPVHPLSLVQLPQCGDAGPSGTRSSGSCWPRLISLVLIAYLLAQAWIDPATLGRGNAAWPMFGVSLLYTMAYAFSITRYKLMQVEDDHQPQRGLFRLQPDGGADLFGSALGQRQVDRRSVVLDPLDLAGGGRGGALGDRGVDPVRSGSAGGSSG